MRTLVVLPTYNEILNVEPMLRTLRKVVPQCDVLVVDDGSPDGTANLAEEIGGEHGYDYFVEIDCDFSHDPNALPTLLSAAEDHDVVIGSRYIPGGHIPQWSLSRRMLSRGGNQYASIMLGLAVADSTAGYRGYSRRGLDLIDFPTVSADGYGFQIEMTYRARRAGASIIEVPISFTDRELGESKMSRAIVFEALWLVTKWAVERPFGRGAH